MSLRYHNDKEAASEATETSNPRKPKNTVIQQWKSNIKDKVHQEKSKEYARGGVERHRSGKNKKLNSRLKSMEKAAEEAAYKAAQAEMLLPEEAGYLEAEGMERTYKFSQKDIANNVDITSAQKSFELDLDEYGPYRLNYTRNGRWMLIGGRKGHVATFDWKTAKLGCELHLQETVRDVCWLHNESMFAVAQKKFVYIYDSTGMELHCLQKHMDINRLEFLPYHFLLASVGNTGYLRYQDTSTGALVSELRTKLGKCDTMAQNPYNSVINLGHSNGTVTMWSPTVSEPLVKMLCHRGPVTSIAVDKSGFYMATTGLDAQLKIWDIRTFKPVHEYYTPTPAHSVQISQQGLLAVGHGPRVSIWKDALRIKQESPYMTHLQQGSQTTDLEFVPFDDVLGVGHSKGITSLIVPGSGEANFDSLEVNPFEVKRQRREGEVRKLLEKLQPDTIALNPNFIGKVEKSAGEVLSEEREVVQGKIKRKQRGRSSAHRRFLKKQSNVIDAKREALKQALEKKKEERQEPKGPPTALDRFRK